MLEAPSPPPGSAEEVPRGFSSECIASLQFDPRAVSKRLRASSCVLSRPKCLIPLRKRAKVFHTTMEPDSIEEVPRGLSSDEEGGSRTKDQRSELEQLLDVCTPALGGDGRVPFSSKL